MSSVINKKLVQKHFSQAVSSYDQYACIQKIMAGELLQLLEAMDFASKVEKILEIGCGTGYFTQLIMHSLMANKRFSSSEIIITDISSEMLEVCKNKISRQFGLNNNLYFVQMDGEKINLDKPVDLIVSNATFQWFQDLNNALGLLRKNLNKNGWLFFTTFGESTFQELRQIFSLVFGDKRHPGQQFISARALEELMVNNDFKEVKVIKDYYRQYFPRARDFFAAIKKVGASNACTPQTGSKGYLGKKRYRDILNYYQKNYSTIEGVYCTYEILYCYGRKS